MGPGCLGFQRGGLLCESGKVVAGCLCGGNWMWGRVCLWSPLSVWLGGVGLLLVVGLVMSGVTEGVGGVSVGKTGKILG